MMRRKLETVVQQEYSAAGGVKSLAEILNHTDRPTERNVLDTIAEERLASWPRRSAACCSSSRTSSSSTTARSSWCCARSTRRTWRWRCAASPRRSRSASVGNMSERGAQMLREEMEFQPPQQKRVVEEAQGRIVGVVRRLEDAGALRDRARRRGRGRLMERVREELRVRAAGGRARPSRCATARVAARGRPGGGRRDPRDGARRGSRRRAGGRARRGARAAGRPRCSALEAAHAEVVELRAATAEAVERDAVELGVQLAEKIVAGDARRSSPSACSTSCAARCGG